MSHLLFWKAGEQRTDSCIYNKRFLVSCQTRVSMMHHLKVILLMSCLQSLPCRPGHSQEKWARELLCPCPWFDDIFTFHGYCHSEGRVSLDKINTILSRMSVWGRDKTAILCRHRDKNVCCVQNKLSSHSPADTAQTHRHCTEVTERLLRTLRVKVKGNCNTGCYEAYKH